MGNSQSQSVQQTLTAVNSAVTNVTTTTTTTASAISNNINSFTVNEPCLDNQDPIELPQNGDLSDYPEMLISGCSSDVSIVVGGKFTIIRSNITVLPSLSV